MTKVLVLYYSSWGHIESMAQSVAEGARSAGAEADLRRVPELLSDDVTQAMHFKTQQDAAIADPASLVDYDAIIVGSPTRFGRLPAQMALFWDRSGSLWLQGKLVGKVGAAFVSTGTQHGGGESTLSSILNNLLCHGMIVTGLPSTFKGQMGVDEIRGGSPYGATTVAAGDGSRLPSQSELDGAHFLGAHIAKIAARQAA